MILYRINQVPNRFYTKFLELVGIRLFPPSVARTDLTFRLSAVLDHEVVVPAGTQVTTTTTGVVAEAEPVVFSTTRDLVIEPPELIAACTSTAADEELYVDIWDDLRYEGGSVVCFPSSPLAPGDAFYLGFARPLAGSLIRLNVEARIEGFGVDPEDLPLTWEVWSGEAWVYARVTRDTTGGLNRDGSVSLTIPMAHEPVTLGGTRAHWLRARLLRPRAGQHAYQASPQVQRIWAEVRGGTVAAEHAVAAPAEVLGRSDGGPGQQFAVRHTPVLPRGPEERVRVLTPKGVEEWEEVGDFTISTGTSRHYTWDGASGTIRFGPQVRYSDGTVRQHGAIPRDGSEILVTGYRHGGGDAGNVGADTLTVMRTTIPFVDSVTNATAARGGVDAETIDNAKERGPMSLRTGQRAVTVRDYERLTMEASSEVARARCVPPATPGGAIRVLVVPRLRHAAEDHVLNDYALSPALFSTIARHLDEHRVLGTAIEVGTPFYQGVSVAALVRALPERPATLVKQRALDVLNAFVNPLFGGHERTGWPFGTDISAAVVAQQLEAVEGVDQAEVVLFEYDLESERRQGPGRELIQLRDDSLFLSAAHQVLIR
jgi:predicted phage baseplate assembly protein